MYIYIIFTYTYLSVIVYVCVSVCVCADDVSIEYNHISSISVSSGAESCDLKVFPEMMQKMDCIEKEQRLVRTEDLPGVKELHGFVSLIYNHEQLTKTL